MATDSLSRPLPHSPIESTAARSRVTAGDIVHAIVAPLASLKLTVVLLTLAILVTFIATLEQTRGDVFDVKMRHFRSLIVAVPFQTLFVPAWFPNMQNVRGVFYMPSGLSILALLLVNLTAAHAMRFKIKAKGKQLVVGTVMALFAALVTWAVIFNNQNPDGFQAKPPIEYTTMWVLLQIGILAVTVASVAGVMLLDRNRKIERGLLVSSALVFGLVLAVTVILEEGAFIGDSAMRILWQLMQSAVAAVVAYMACLALFRRKAGMVLIHLGVAGLMLNEIFVTVTNNEQRMTIFEGETVAHAIDIRATEMAIINTSDDETDEIIAIPGSLLQQGGLIEDPQLPFKIKTVRYLPASDLRPASAVDNKANAGVGLIAEAFDVPPVAGTDSEQVADMASAYVELFDKETSKSLGVHLISQALAESKADTINVDGTDYRIALRFKTEYKPYALTLDKATRVDYLGTRTPKYYGSDVQIDDFDTGLKTSQTIFMNEPLRYGNETFYQSGMDTGPGGKQFSTLQIVTNVGWMIPYVCCMFTVVGLMAQFGESLLRFLSPDHRHARAATADAVPVAELADQDATQEATHSASGVVGWIPAGVLTLLFAGWAASQFFGAARSIEKEGMRLDLLAQVPVTYEGRVQPLGSFAINTARQLREYESIDDGDDERQPAIRWFADVVFEAEGAKDYRTFRIDDPTVINALKLPKAFPRDRDRKKFVYTIDEVYGARNKLAELIPNPQERDRKNWTPLESRLELLGQKVQQLLALELTFGVPGQPLDDTLMRLENADRLRQSTLTPLVVPQDHEETPWLRLSTANTRRWLKDMAADMGADTTNNLAGEIVEREILPQLRETMIRDQVIAKLIAVPEFRKAMSAGNGNVSDEQLTQMLQSRWAEMPDQLVGPLREVQAPLVEAQLAQQKPMFAANLEKILLSFTGGRTNFDESVDDNGAVELLNQLRPAYQKGDAKTFNETLETYLANVSASPPEGYHGLTLMLERFYNSYMPFYVSLVIYVVVFLISAVSWLFFQKPLGRAALSLLVLAMLIHGSGILMRIMISGRPPVTNLYSSVLFVSLVGVGLLGLFELATKLRIGTALAGLSGFLAMVWAHSMTIIDGDTFTVMVAVLDTSFWLATHVVCISLGYATTFVAGLLGGAYIIAGMITPVLQDKSIRKLFSNLIYGMICFGLLTSFFGTVLGGLWGDDSWGRFWGWDPKENGALMIVLANAVILHARWGGMIRERGMASIALLSNIVVLWSWKGVNAMGVGLHAYAGTEDNTLALIVAFGFAHLLLAMVALIPLRWWMSFHSSSNTSRLA